MKVIKVIIQLIIIAKITGTPLSSSLLCENICRTNQQCLTRCQSPLNAEQTDTSLSAPSCGISRFGSEPTSYILNGVDVSLHRFPWMVSLKELSDTDKYEIFAHTCGGALITTRHVLTAAHCVIDPFSKQMIEVDKYVIVLGTNNRSDDKAVFAPIERITLHEKYNLSGIFQDHDIALIELKNEITARIKGNHFVVNTVCLPKHLVQLRYGHATLSGWGATDIKFPVPPYTLKSAQFMIIPYDTCLIVLRDSRDHNETDEWGAPEEETTMLNTFIPEQKLICTMPSVPPGTGRVAESTNAYFADSGGPLVQYFDNDRAYVVGVTSFGTIDYNTPLTFFTQVSHFIPWIKNNIKQD